MDRARFAMHRRSARRDPVLSRTIGIRARSHEAWHPEIHGRRAPVERVRVYLMARNRDPAKIWGPVLEMQVVQSDNNTPALPQFLPKEKSWALLKTSVYRDG